jgi:hypothetical protein
MWRASPSGWPTTGGNTQSDTTHRAAAAPQYCWRHAVQGHPARAGCGRGGERRIPFPAAPRAVRACGSRSSTGGRGAAAPMHASSPQRSTWFSFTSLPTSKFFCFMS